MPYDLNDVVKILTSGRNCSISFIKADTKKKIGGEVITFNRCKLARRQPQVKDSTIAVKGEGRIKARNANQAFNFTRNVELSGGAIRTIHPLLIFEINNVQVI